MTSAEAWLPWRPPPAFRLLPWVPAARPAEDPAHAFLLARCSVAAVCSAPCSSATGRSCCGSQSESQRLLGVTQPHSCHPRACALSRLDLPVHSGRRVAASPVPSKHGRALRQSTLGVPRPHSRLRHQMTCGILRGLDPKPPIHRVANRSSFFSSDSLKRTLVASL